MFASFTRSTPTIRRSTPGQGENHHHLHHHHLLRPGLMTTAIVSMFADSAPLTPWRGRFVLWTPTTTTRWSWQSWRHTPISLTSTVSWLLHGLLILFNSLYVLGVVKDMDIIILGEKGAVEREQVSRLHFGHLNKETCRQQSREPLSINVRRYVNPRYEHVCGPTDVWTLEPLRHWGCEDGKSQAGPLFKRM